MKRDLNIEKVFSLLEKDHKPTMLEELSYHTPFQMLIMTMLSARAKDATTIPIVKEMFKKYPDPQDFIDMDIKKLEKMIFKIGFYRVKAQNVKKISKIILEKYNGVVPDSFEELTSLPGVGRKTANCMLAYVFDKPAIAVDVHVHRVSNRLGWVKTDTPFETEMALQKLIPKNLWSKANSMLVGHGQSLCGPFKPQCEKCPVRKYCEFGRGKM